MLDGPDGVEAVRGVAAARRGRYPGSHGCPRMSLVLLLSGPNLNLLGEREPEIYGTATLADDVTTAEAAGRPRLEARASAVRPRRGPRPGGPRRPRPGRGACRECWGADPHVRPLHDALAAFEGPVVELHLSNPAAREPFRHKSVLGPVASGAIAGFGGLGYELVDAAAALLKGS